MPLLRVIDQAGNKTDYETNYLPRIGERIMLQYGITPVQISFRATRA